MSDFFELDPLTGIRTDFHWRGSTDSYDIVKTADVEPVLDRAKAMANEGGKCVEDIRRGWWHYATVPPIVILQMRAKGIDIFNKDHQKRMFEEINTHYPKLKCVQANEGGKEKLIVT